MELFAEVELAGGELLPSRRSVAAVVEMEREFGTMRVGGSSSE
jgi:hypothetical protein